MRTVSSIHLVFTVLVSLATVGAVGCDDCGSSPPEGTDLALDDDGPAARLASANGNMIFLCDGVIRRFPDSPEAAEARAQAQARFEAVRDGLESAEGFAELRPEVKDVLRAVLLRGESDPCRRELTIEIRRELAPGTTSVSAETMEYHPAWQTLVRHASSAAAALSALLPEWLETTVVLGAYRDQTEPDEPRLIVTYTLARQGNGFVLGTTARALAPPIINHSLRLSTIHPPNTVEVRYLVRPAETGPTVGETDDAVLTALANASELTLKQALGLSPARPDLAPHAGRWALSATPRTDDCGGEIVFGARYLHLYAGARIVHVDVVDRTYDVYIEGDQVVARGFFPGPVCADTHLVEDWTLTPTDDDTLTGIVTSSWVLGSACDRPCTITFDVTATRAPEEAAPELPAEDGP
jgi:hypothetical protein